MQQTTISQQPLTPRRRRLTEKERAEILARIIDIILADPGQAPASAEAGENRLMATSKLSSPSVAMQPGDMA
jgi:hypothetical protein